MSAFSGTQEFQLIQILDCEEISRGTIRIDYYHIVVVPYSICLSRDFTLSHFFLLEKGHRGFFFKKQRIGFFHSFFPAKGPAILEDNIHYLILEEDVPLLGPILVHFFPTLFP